MNRQSLTKLHADGGIEDGADLNVVQIVFGCHVGAVFGKSFEHPSDDKSLFPKRASQVFACAIKQSTETFSAMIRMHADVDSVQPVSVWSVSRQPVLSARFHIGMLGMDKVGSVQTA